MKIVIFKLFIIFCTLISTIGYVYSATVEDVKQNIILQSKQMGVEPAVMLSIAKTESGFNQNAKSVGGHIGVFQLSHSTAKSLGVNPYDLEDNIKGGISYYKNMYNTFGTRELAIAAYNAGPYAIKRNNNTIPARTQAYVSKIMKNYQDYKNQNL